MTSGERKVTMEARLAISPKRPRLVKSTPGNKQYNDHDDDEEENDDDDNDEMEKEDNDSSNSF